MDAENELKAGHPPATKVGNMRVVQHKSTKDDSVPKATETPKEEKEENGEDVAETEEGAEKKKPTVMVSGAKITEEVAYPAEAVKAYHEKKPLPTHEKGMSNKPNIIHQPKK